MAKKSCACNAHKNHKLGKTDIRAPRGKDIGRLFAAAGGFTGGRLLRRKVTDKSGWLQKNPIVWGIASTALGVIGFANLENDNARYASVGLGIDGVDQIFSTIQKLKDNPAAIIYNLYNKDEPAEIETAGTETIEGLTQKKYIGTVTPSMPIEQRRAGAMPMQSNTMVLG